MGIEGLIFADAEDEVPPDAEQREHWHWGKALGSPSEVDDELEGGDAASKRSANADKLGESEIVF